MTPRFRQKRRSRLGIAFEFLKSRSQRLRGTVRGGHIARGVRVLSLAFVRDFGLITSLRVNLIINHLGSAVRQIYSIAPLDDIRISFFFNLIFVVSLWVVHPELVLVRAPGREV